MSLSDTWEVVSDGVLSATDSEPDSQSEGGTAVIEALEEEAGHSNHLQGMLLGGMLPSFYPAALLFGGSPTAAGAAGQRFSLDLAGGSGGASPRAAAAGMPHARHAGQEPAGTDGGASSSTNKGSAAADAHDDERRGADEDAPAAQQAVLVTGLLTTATALAVLLLLLGLMAAGSGGSSSHASSYDAAWGLAGPRSLRITLATGPLHAPPTGAASRGRPLAGGAPPGHATPQLWLLRVPWWLTATNASSAASGLTSPAGALPMAQLPPVLQRVMEGSSHATMTPAQRLRLELWLLHLAHHKPTPPQAPKGGRRCCCCMRAPGRLHMSAGSSNSQQQASPAAAAPSCNATLAGTLAWWLAAAPAPTRWHTHHAGRGAAADLPRNMTDLWVGLLPAAPAAGCDSGAAQAAAWQAAMAAFAFQALPQRRARSPVCANPGSANDWFGFRHPSALQCLHQAPGAHSSAQHGRRQQQQQPAAFVCSAMNATLLWQVQAAMQQAPWATTASALSGAEPASAHGWLFSCSAQEASEAYSCRQAWHQAWPAADAQTNSSGWLWLLLAQQYGGATHGRARSGSGRSSIAHHHAAHAWALFNSSSSFLMLLTGGGRTMPPCGTPATAAAAPTPDQATGRSGASSHKVAAAPPLHTVEPTQAVPALYRPPLPCLLLNPPSNPSGGKAAAGSTPAALHPFAGGRSSGAANGSPNVTARHHAAPPAASRPGGPRAYSSPAGAMELVRRWLLQQLPAGAADVGASWPWLPLLPASLLANSSFLGRHYHTNTSSGVSTSSNTGTRMSRASTDGLSLPMLPPMLASEVLPPPRPRPLKAHPDALRCAAPPLAAVARGVPTFALLQAPTAGAAGDAEEPQSCALWEEAFHVPAHRPHRKLLAEHQQQAALTDATAAATCSTGDSASFLLVHTLPALTAGGAAAALGGHPQAASAVDIILSQLGLDAGWWQQQQRPSSSHDAATEPFFLPRASYLSSFDYADAHMTRPGRSFMDTNDDNNNERARPTAAAPSRVPAFAAAACGAGVLTRTPAHVCANNGTLALALAAAARLAAAASQVDAFVGRINSQLASAGAGTTTIQHPRCINSSSSPLAPLLSPRVAARASGAAAPGANSRVVPAAQWVGSFIQLPMLPAQREPQPADGCRHGLQAAILPQGTMLSASSGGCAGGTRRPSRAGNGTAEAATAHGGKPLWMMSA